MGSDVNASTVQEVFPLCNRLLVRLCDRRFEQSTSNDRPNTAIFQIVSDSYNALPFRCPAHSILQVRAVYLHKGSAYPHPYELETVADSFNMQNNQIIADDQGISGLMEVNLKLRCLRDFAHEDLKRVFDAADDTLEGDPILHDFHEFYLVINLYERFPKEQLVWQYWANDVQPLHLPTITSSLTDYTQTMTRYRYPTEQRDGKFDCDFKLIHVNPALLSYRLSISLISNTIPSCMDTRNIGWTFKCAITGPTNNTKKSHALNHPEGIVVADIFGPELKFSGKLVRFGNSINRVQSNYEPPDFRRDLERSYESNNCFFVSVTGQREYFNYGQERRTNPNIRGYLPFPELYEIAPAMLGLRSMDKSAELFKVYKKYKSEQLMYEPNTEKRTYSRDHVRPCTGAYFGHNVLFSETIHPPLRDQKHYPQLEIKRILPREYEFRASKTLAAYCEYDHNVSKKLFPENPYLIQFVFVSQSENLGLEQLLELFKSPHISVPTSYVEDCPALLDFKVPDCPQYNEHRAYIRLHHARSRDYNTSDIYQADERWIYYADATSMLIYHIDIANNEGNGMEDVDTNITSMLIPSDSFCPDLDPKITDNDDCYICYTPCLQELSDFQDDAAMSSSTGSSEHSQY